jgi:hypothetical protein
VKKINLACNDLLLKKVNFYTTPIQTMPTRKIAIFSSAQKLTVEGIALDTSKLYSGVRIILNDTINRLFAKSRDADTYATFNRVIKDTDFTAFTDTAGRFRIQAKLTDSLFFESHFSITKAFLVADLLKMDSIKILLEPEPCAHYERCIDTAPKHYVFIGEKIELQQLKTKDYCDAIIINREYRAVYKIVDKKAGNYQKDTIQFHVYDHRGGPEFAQHQYVMLFVSDYCGRLIHQKYLYYPVYKTIDGRWASPSHYIQYSRLDSGSTIKPERLIFKERVEIDLAGYDSSNIQLYFPANYYTINNGKAIPMYGNYAPDLIEIQQQTYLKARGEILKK